MIRIFKRAEGELTETTRGDGPAMATIVKTNPTNVVISHIRGTIIVCLAVCALLG
jgi:hypothetical protein